MGPNLKKSLSFLWILAAVWLSLRLVLPFVGPFLLGAATAFILNTPMRFLERTLFGERGPADPSGTVPLFR